MIDRVSSRNTKAQILAAFNQLYDIHEQLQAQYDRLVEERETLQRETSELRVLSTAVEGKPEEAAFQETSRDYTIDAILNGLAILRASFGSAINELSARLTAEVSRLEEQHNQVQAQTNWLAELFDLDVGEGTLDRLIQEHVQKSAAFDEQTRQEREAFEREMAEKREAWKREREEHARAVKERGASLRKERKRGEAEYKYDLATKRRVDAEKYEQEKQRRYRELEAFAEAKEKEWAEREEAVAKQEREYAELGARAMALPGELEAALKRAAREGTERARRQAKVIHDLLAKEEEGNRRVAELKIQSLEEIIQQQAQQIASLSAQLEAVVKQDQELAIRAIEGASHETSFQSIREIALEQAKRMPKGS
jgi:hypothetical protein